MAVIALVVYVRSKSRNSSFSGEANSVNGGEQLDGMKDGGTNGDPRCVGFVFILRSLDLEWLRMGFPSALLGS